MSIICLAGKAHAGKDSMGNVLVKRHGYTRLALADPLRELCSSVFRMDYELFSDTDKKDKDLGYRLSIDYSHIDKIIAYVEDKWKFLVDGVAKTGLEDLFNELISTPRDALKTVGMALRRYIRDDIWVVLAFEKICKIGTKVVVTDCRFENERDAFQNAGAVICLIKRDNDLDNPDGHISENDLGKESDYDVVFNNNNSLNQFESEVSEWYSYRRTDLEYYTEFKHVTRKELDGKE